MSVSPALDRHSSPVRTIEDLLAHQSAPARASLATVVGAFVSIAVAQAGLLALIITALTGPGQRIALALAVVLPTLLYVIVAAWDERQLRDAGLRTAPSWGYAFVAPPVYLALRWRRINNDRLSPFRAVLAAVVVQLVVVIIVAVAVGAATLALPAPTADAAPALGYTASELADLSTADGIETSIQEQWASFGSTGTASCPVVTSTEPGAEVTCLADYEGEAIRFTVQFTEPIPGELPWSVVSWMSES